MQHHRDIYTSMLRLTSCLRVVDACCILHNFLELHGDRPSPEMIQEAQQLLQQSAYLGTEFPIVDLLKSVRTIRRRTKSWLFESNW